MSEPIHVLGACPHDCPDTCAWTATVEDGVVTGIHADRDHPITAGHLCVKMQRYEERMYHPDRLLMPLVRTGPKGSATFRPASWDEALAVVRAGLEDAMDRHGPTSVLPFSYMGTMGQLQGSSMDRRLFNRLGTAKMDGTICFAAGAWAWGLTYPTGWAAPDIETASQAELVVAWGANMVSTHLHFWPYFLQARKRGATIVCIDPVRTKTARAADIHLAPRPGSDGALALGLLHVIFAEGLEDAEFLAERTVGADELRARAAEWPLERAARATGLAPEAITDLARRLAAARPSFIKLGPGAQRHADAGQAFRAVLCLPAVTGAWRYPGGGVHVHSAQTFPSRSAAMERPDLRPDDQPLRVINQVQLGRALAGTYDEHEPLAALVVSNTNPAVVCPDSRSVLAGLAREDLFTVVAEQFMTDTARYADVVLPATTQLEHLDVVTSWGHRYLTLNLPAVAPLGQSRPNTEIFRMIAAAMGLDHPALAESDETLLATYLDGYDAASVAELYERGWTKIEPVEDPRPKAMLRSEGMAHLGLDPLPDAPDGPDPGDGERRLLVLTPKSHHFLNSTAVNHARLRKMAGAPEVLLAPQDAAERGVAEGALARLTTENGSITVPARLSSDVLAGTAVLISNWWNDDFPGGQGANVLTDQELTDVGGAPRFQVLAEVAPALP
ncbi:MAG TPA: molybdopterin-dependent oxidoreductase [Acidimicrobiales bacterium]